MRQKKVGVRASSVLFVGLLTLSGSLAIATIPAVAATKVKTISLVVEQTDGGPGTPYFTFYNDVANAYMKLHPNVKITTKYTTFQQMEDAAPLVLSGSNIPSLYEDNQGYLSIFKLAQDKLITPLDNYARQFGWHKELSAPLLGYDGELTLSPPVIGTGQLYGLSVEANIMGIYYNKKILSDIHQQVPSTLNEFVHDMGLARKAGYIGMSIGAASDSYALGELWGLVAGSIEPSTSGPTTVMKLELGAPGATWTARFAEQAIGMMETWNKDGYLSPNLLGLTLGDYESQFTSGKALFAMDGNWNNTVYQKMGAGVGFLMLPSGTSAHGVEPIAVGGDPFVIPARAKNQAAAAAYLNYLCMGQQAAELYIKKFQLLPVVPVRNESSMFTGVARQVAKAWDTGSQGTHSNGFPGINTPDSLTLLNELTEEVVAGKLTPAQFGSQMQADEKSFRSQLK